MVTHQDVDQPSGLDIKELVIVSPAVEGHSPSGVPLGFFSGHIYQNISRARRYRDAGPYQVFAAKN